MLPKTPVGIGLRTTVSGGQYGCLLSESSVLGMMGALCEGVVVWGRHAVSLLEKLLDLGERGSFDSAV